ncbi:hypothetical protein ACFLWC_04155 [Chloroflexota bacterium]
MVRNNTEKSNDTESKKQRGRKQQAQQANQLASDGPSGTSDQFKGLFNSMMPMIMMVMMMAIITPMLKRTAQNDEGLKDQ